MLKNKKYLICLLLLLVCAVFLRFYKLEKLFFFNIDEEWYNFIVRKITVFHKPVLIGWEIPGGILVPPVMFYFGAIIMLLFNNNPLGFAFTSSLFGVLGVVLIYFVGKSLFKSDELNLYASIIYCFSFLVNIYNRLSINLLFVPILSLLTYLSLIKIIENKDKKYLIVLGFVFAFSTQEGSMLSLIILTIFVFIIYKVKFSIKQLFVPVSIFLITFVPVVIFDIRHDFFVSKKILNIFHNTSAGTFSIINILTPIRIFLSFPGRMLVPSGPTDINIQLLPCERYLSLMQKSTPVIYPLFGYLLLLFFIHRFIVAKLGTGEKIILSHILIIILGLVLFSIIKPGYAHEWFFVVLMPAFCYVISYVLIFLEKNHILRNFSLLFILAFISINISSTISLNSTIGYKDKLEAVKYVSDQTGKANFEFSVLGNKCNGYGYRYLFTYMGKNPVTPYVDSLYINWLYSEDVIDRNIKYKVVFVPIVDLDTKKDKQDYLEIKKNAIKNKRFGNLEVFITIIN